MQISQPRLAKDNLEKNEKLFFSLHALATKKECTCGQLGPPSWVQHQGDDVAPYLELSR